MIIWLNNVEQYWQKTKSRRYIFGSWKNFLCYMTIHTENKKDSFLDSQVCDQSLCHPTPLLLQIEGVWVYINFLLWYVNTHILHFMSIGPSDNWPCKNVFMDVTLHLFFLYKTSTFRLRKIWLKLVPVVKSV